MAQQQNDRTTEARDIETDSEMETPNFSLFLFSFSRFVGPPYMQWPCATVGVAFRT